MSSCPKCNADVQPDQVRCPKCGVSVTRAKAEQPFGSAAEDRKLPLSLDPVEEREGKLPFSAWWPVAGGALVGILLRLVFSGSPGGPFAAMMASFVYLVPLVVGAVTVYVAERKYRRSFWYYLWAPFIANALFVLGTLVIMIEGLICAVVIVPLFATIGVVGGLAMGMVCRLTRWPKHTLYSLAFLPLLFGGLEGNMATPSRIDSVERTVVIRAAPDVVWRQIMHADAIQPDEMRHAWIFRIGVPLPLAGVVEESPDGPVRKIRMGKNVHYDQIFTEIQEHRYVHFIYRLYPDSFPPHALDDHVVVGGYYFDIRDTSYRLTPVGEGTELTIRMGYRVTTQFNWYAETLARYLLGNFEHTILDFYRIRSEMSQRERG